MKPVTFRPPFWLSNRHLQTILGSTPPRKTWLERRARSHLARAESQVIECSDGARLLAEVDLPEAEPNGRVVVMIHGWEGHAGSAYMVTLAPLLCGQGFTVVRLNLRDHGDSHHLNRDLFHSCRLQEVVDAVSWVHQQYPQDELSLVGFSLGGNFCLRVGAAAEEAGIAIGKIVAVCPVLNPADTMIALDSGWSAYQNFFLKKWRRSLNKKREAFPSLYQFTDLRRFRSLESMTDFFVREYTEYGNLDSYLAGYALTGERLSRLKVSSSILLAEDDPVIPIAGLKDIKLPKAVTVHRTRYGGHCGFLNSLRLRSWLDEFVLHELTN
ncbi:MAG: YheT family hydrolase [Gammaproteobacteria bacterium]